MLQIERLEKLKEYIEEKEFVSIKDIVEKFNISKATVRRYLIKLEESQAIEITRGGAVVAQGGSAYEQPYQVKRQMNLEEKRRIAEEAANLIHRNDSVFLDSSSTVFEMTNELLQMKHIMVATNDILIAGALKDNENISVSVIGGTLRKHFFTLTGLFAETIIKDIYLDYAFMGIDAVSLKGGLMLTNVEEVPLKRAVMDAANKVVLLCDHTKFEQVCFLNVCKIEDIDLIITGKELEKDIYDKYLEIGAKIKLV